MRLRALFALPLLAIINPFVWATAPKSYKHASEYQVAVLDETVRLHTGNDVTASHTSTDAKLDTGGQGMHFLHTDSGDYRVEAPINSGLSVLASLGSNRSTPVTVHNKWFLDKVQANTQVLFASKCATSKKNHPHDTVRCTFWFPDPDSNEHEYMTQGDFTPYVVGDGANTEKVANTLCGTGKLNAETEAKLCAAVQPRSATAEK